MEAIFDGNGLCFDGEGKDGVDFSSWMGEWNVD
jgi:hypothetical protein